MKTTNNKLLDNTGNPVSNNRPNHERKLYELRCTKHDDETHVIYSNWDFLKEDTNSRVCDGIYRATGIVKIELTPYDDAEYIEYLEEQVTDTFAKLVSVEELSKQTISTLEKENKELKEQVELKNSVMSVVNGIEQRLSANQQDQFLKVVESFFEKHKLFEMKDGYGGYMNECKCGWNDYSDIRYDEHLLQEIKSAIEKVKHV